MVVQVSDNMKKSETISISSSSDKTLFSSDDDDDYMSVTPNKRRKILDVLPVGFLDPITKTVRKTMDLVQMPTVKQEPPRVGHGNMDAVKSTIRLMQSCNKQFWKAGDYEGSGDSGLSLADMDHVRVHPRFLHSNATSHKWVLGAFAELLDNALDEVCNGATYVHVDVLNNPKDRTKMVLVEDNGGGMTPDKMRQCISLGYSSKSKMSNLIGQYGNGFKTSTMRIGADVIVFSRCQGKHGGRTTQSIGMLSYTFLRNTGKEDIVVPMIDYEKIGESTNKLLRSSSECWQTNLETIVQWSPYETESDLLRQFDFLNDKGTRVIIYNLWEDDQGSLELDFYSDQHDIQINGVSRDEKKIEMAEKYPNSKHFLTYRHSLRSYASILYLSLPPGFRIILRGKDVEHHNIISDMMHATKLTYRPAVSANMASKDPNMVAEVTLGFVKDATSHIDVQGFNVYHKNRLIKPFWRVWNSAGSDGRGVLGVLEANFVEPAHDKQGFERTIVLSRLEARLIHLQKNYWSTKCQLIGYAPRRGKKTCTTPEAPTIDIMSKLPSDSKYMIPTDDRVLLSAPKLTRANRHTPQAVPVSEVLGGKTRAMIKQLEHDQTTVKAVPMPISETQQQEHQHLSYQTTRILQAVPLPTGEVQTLASNNPPRPDQTALNVKTEQSNGHPSTDVMVYNLSIENQQLRITLERAMDGLQFQKDRNKSLENQLQDAKLKMDLMDKERQNFIACLSEERSRRDQQEQVLHKKLREATQSIQSLLGKLKFLGK